MDNHYNHFKKIDAHSHIGKFGSPFNIDFDLQRLTENNFMSGRMSSE